MIVIQTNTDSREEAEEIARVLLHKKLIFAAHINQTKAFYLWKGNRVEGKEYVITMRTLDDKKDAAVKLIEELHSYQVPPIVIFPALTSSNSYDNKIKDELE
ncbi:divalent-cation tolerance protein CutA [Candidatus Woesearchaeota archaeon]|nr:MAG: divalent-cation tolerance protein CutA [Candidatus Woesearchaeota archaeon]